MDIKKYNNIKDKYNSPNTKKLLTVSKGLGETDEINDFKFPNEKDFYFSYRMVLEDSVYQLEKSKENISAKKISEFSDDYYRLNDYDGYEENFDETNEVFEGDLYESFLFKISSDKISSELNNRLEKFVNEKGQDCNFEEFFKLLDPDSAQDDDLLADALLKNPGWTDSMNPDGSYHYILKAIGIDPKDIETIYRDVTIDDNGDIVCWYLFSEFNLEQFSIEIKN